MMIDNLKHTTNYLQISKLPTLKISFLNHFQNRLSGQISLEIYLFRRKRSSLAGAAVAYDKDAEMKTDQTEGNTVSNITFLDDKGDSSNLHEFLPPSKQTISQ